MSTKPQSFSTRDHALLDEDLDALTAEVSVTLWLKNARDIDWVTRWFARYPMQTDIHCGDTNRLATLAAQDIVVVDAGLKAKRGFSLELLHAQANRQCRVMALCHNQRELARARALPDIEVIYKPTDWELVAQRVGLVAQWLASQRQVAALQAELSQMVTSRATESTQNRRRNDYEAVTGLPNRNRFMELLERGMTATSKAGGSLAVMSIGFARFNLIVDALGQTEADVLMAETANKLTGCLADLHADSAYGQGTRSAIVGQLSTDAFGVMLTWSGDRSTLRRMTNVLVDVLSQPVVSRGHSVHLSASLGICVFPDDARNPDSLLQRADNAMREARRVGGGCRFFAAEAEAAASRKLTIENDLQRALHDGTVSVAYQPILFAGEAQAPAMEALVRWSDAERFEITTEAFVQIAEESALILELGEYVLARACAQLQTWRRAGKVVSHICVNVSRNQLMDDHFQATYQSLIAQHDLNPGDIEFELSERGVLSREPGIVARIHALKTLGARISIDDFGTGDSAIAYLKNLPIDAIKIDKSYIEGLPEAADDLAITSAMVAMGQRLGLEVIVEGVETEAQYRTLFQMGCNGFQGYLFARPVLGDDAIDCCSEGLQTFNNVLAI